MASSPACTCRVCPVHVPAGPSIGPDDEAADAQARWAGPAREHLDSIVDWLDGTEGMSTGHGDLEERLQVHSREQYRLLLQGHLDERARRERRRAEVIGSDAVPRPRVENGHECGLTSVFGSVTVTRKAYRATPGATAPTPDPADGVGPVPEPESARADRTADATAGRTADRTARNLYPADAVLNLPPMRQSAGLSRLAAIEAARGSFDDAGEAIERATGVRLGKRQVENLARHAAADVDDFYTARRPEPCPDLVLGLQCDGKGIVMRPGHLRPGTAKAAAKATTKQSTRLSPGQKHGRKRMAEIIAVYDLTPEPRTVDDIIAAPTTTRQGNRQGKKTLRKGPVVTGKWLHANVIDDIPAVLAAMLDEAERRDPHHERTWVALIDGNNQQIDAITAQATTRGITVTILIDFVHVLEYLWKAAWTFFTPGDPDAEDWVAGQARTVLAGRAVDAAASITHQADAGRFRGTERTGADEAVAYLRRKAPYLDYPTALANGWQIATGIIEGAARFLIKDRMDLTGARWTVPGAEAVLRLRAVIANGDFDDYWHWHQQQELRRNHLDHYQQLDLAA